MLNNRKTDITLLQETHSTPESIRKWKSEWTGRSIWHSGPIPKSSGVALLLKENSTIEIIHIKKGRKNTTMHYEIRTRNISNNKYLRYNKSYGQEKLLYKFTKLH